MNPTKNIKLWHHKLGEKYGEAQLVLNPKAYPELKIGDLVEISQQIDGDTSRLLLQYTHRFEDFNQKDTVSVEQSLAIQFRLKIYCDVSLSLASKEEVALDLVELTFKEQYLSRSDMWRIRKELLNSCIHVNQNTLISRVRFYVNELWCLGERVSCGFVNDSTRIVFRTTSAMMYIFIQMSSEMWEFDTQGDLYLEKCVNGFLPEVFRGWAESKCSHYINFVIFSRWYYKTDHDLPESLIDHAQKDYRGRYYQDFYRLLVQNEHYEDWAPVLLKLKLAFHNYYESIRNFHENLFKDHPGVIEWENAPAADGNFLESLNLSLNVYAKHFLDRKLERTGQQVVLITPGGGVFNVDRDFATVTKQRVIDLGVSIDIVCLGEQPLHAVPLFIYHSLSRAKNPALEPNVEDYFLPHWMNYNFYNPQVYRRTCCTFRPRLKIPEHLLQRPIEISINVGDEDPYSYPDFDAFDREVFRPHLPVRKNAIRGSKSTVGQMSPSLEDEPSFGSAPSLWHGDEDKSYDRGSGGEEEGDTGQRPLINPFIPSEISVRITANRRRWIHVFPTNRSGLAKQSHVLVAGSSLTYAREENREEGVKRALHNLEAISKRASADLIPIGPGAGPVTGTGPQGKTLVWAWGPTGEEQWNPDVEIGVDWKSLVQPALLPMTTDFFPDSRSLKENYVFNEHTILLDDQETDARKVDIFEELVSQRLQRGFQIIILPKGMLHSAVANSAGPSRLRSEKECYLSVNRIYHRICLLGPCIYVTQFMPRHLQQLQSIHYRYLFQVPDNKTYEFSQTQFELERLDKVNWSVLDNYILSPGESEAYSLHPGMKFWDVRFVLLPSCHPGTKIIAGNIADPDFYCDLYSASANEEMSEQRLTDNFLKLMESINKIKHTHRLSPNAINPPSPGPRFSRTDLNALIEALKSADGLNFLQNDQLSSRSFVSVELVQWFMTRVEEINSIQDGIALGQQLLDKALIAEVSKTARARFRYGFILYHIPGPETEEKSSGQWIECEFFCKQSMKSRLRVLEDFDLDGSKRGGRREYGRLLHSSCYSPSFAFQLQLQWLVGAGATLAELIFSVWSRRAAQCFFQVIPVPLQPFDLPTNISSDPLRCAVHIPLPKSVIGVLPAEPFKRLRVVILERFGFLRLPAPDDQYVHYSGGMFALLPSDGFLWSWNCMLSHKYRSPTTADEAFQDKVFADFSRFCANENGRLKKVFNQIMADSS